VGIPGESKKMTVKRGHKFVTKAIETKLAKSPIGSKDGNVENAPVIVKFFSTANDWRWYVVEAEKQEDGDWLLYGLVQGYENELGYFLLSELANCAHPKFRGMAAVERDCYFGKHTLGEFMDV